jgi:hypothetical protein
VYEFDRFGAGSVMVWAVLEFVVMVALSSKLCMGHVIPWPAFLPDMIFINVFLYVRNIEHQTLASFLFMTSV